MLVIESMIDIDIRASDPDFFRSKFLYYQIDGAVVVWDLREPSHLITRLQSGDLDYQLRQPSYSTGITDRIIIVVFTFIFSCTLE